MRKIWNWLSIENNRKVLSFLGSGISVIVAALWVYYQQTEPQQKQKEVATSSSKPSINISGIWRDPVSGSISQTIQEGNSFRYIVKGLLYGIPYQSSGNGTIKGKRVESAYQSNIPSTGHCAGMLSIDGKQIKSTCVDSVNGEFESVWVRS